MRAAGRRAISTVADVSLALVVLVAAITVVTTVPQNGGIEPNDPDAPHTTETIAATTLNATYSVEPVTEESQFPGDPGEYDHSDLQRVVRGPVPAQIAAGTIANVTFGPGQGSDTVSVADDSYTAAVETGLLALLVESSFQTHVSAYWAPFQNATVQARLELGNRPPVDADTSLSKLRISSGMPAVRGRAVDAVEDETEFGVVADIAAAGIIQGLVPELASQRALESSGLDRDLTVYRYRRLATVLDGTTADNSTFRTSITRETADAEWLNEYLAAALAVQLEASLRQQFDSARTAASALSLSELTITVRTWDQ